MELDARDGVGEFVKKSFALSQDDMWRAGVGRRFESRPLHFTYDPGQVVHTNVPLFIKAV